MPLESNYIGEIIRESLIDPSVLEDFKAFLVKARVENVANFTPSVWHVERYRMPLQILGKLIPLLENNIDRKQWYIHFYSEDRNEMFVVLAGKTFRLPKQRDASWDAMIAYGEKVGVGRRWTENIPVDFEL